MGQTNTLQVLQLQTLPTVLLSQIIFAKNMWMIVVQVVIEKALGQAQIAVLLLTFQRQIAYKLANLNYQRGVVPYSACTIVVQVVIEKALGQA